MDAKPLLVRPEEAARLLGIGRSKVFEEMATGRLASIRIGRSRRISASGLASYVDQLETEQAGDVA